VFDVEITDFYGGAATQLQMIIENKSAATRVIPITLEAPLGLTNCPLAVSASLVIKDSVTPSLPTANELDEDIALSCNIPNAIDAVTPRMYLTLLDPRTIE
jgi:hypothetical protein